MVRDNIKTILVTIICSFCVAVTSIIAAFIAREKITTYEYKEVPVPEFIITTDYFPLAVGNFWVYEGHVYTCITDSEKNIEKKVKVVMSVEDVIRGENAVLYILNGHPSDAVWPLEVERVKDRIIRLQQSKYGFLVVSNKIFYVEEEKIKQVAKAIKEFGYLEEDLIKQSDLEFEFPLFKGLRIGAVEQISRNDLKYYWYVNDKGNFHEADKNKVRTYPVYQLVYNTMPGFIELNFIPYLGITSYKYSHHGSRCEVSIFLKNYKIHNQ